MFNVNNFLLGLEIQREKEELRKAGLSEEDIQGYFEYFLDNFLDEVLDQVLVKEEKE